MKDLHEIRMNKSFTLGTRVYLMAKELYNEGKLDPELWYGILELTNTCAVEEDLSSFKEENS